MWIPGKGGSHCAVVPAQTTRISLQNWRCLGSASGECRRETDKVGQLDWGEGAILLSAAL